MRADGIDHGSQPAEEQMTSATQRSETIDLHFANIAVRFTSEASQRNSE